jgi:PKD repeat protein
MLKHRFLIGATVAVIISMVFSPWGANTVQAAPPSNDDFNAAKVIDGLPFTDPVNTTEATIGDDDPYRMDGNPSYASVWYAFTPSVDVGVTANTSGSSYGTVVEVFTGERGSLIRVVSSFMTDPVVFRASAGTTYYFMVNQYSPYPQNGGYLVFNVIMKEPPNDNFDNAVVIPSLPFAQGVDMDNASTEPNEPGCGNMQGTVWFAYTPETSASYTIDVRSINFTTVGVYLGASLSNLVQVGCLQRLEWDPPLRLNLDAGTTYYFQASGYIDGWDRWVGFNLYFTPPPNPSFSYWNDQPHIFETVNFYNSSDDPGGGGIATTTWNFGDGTTSQDWNPVHQFAKDGDYNVQLTVVTNDGRTATASRLVQVRTHDVAITRFSVPQSARAGQTRAITVEVSNQRYPETVRVILYKSTPTGDLVQVGWLIQTVPVRSNRTTPFAFNYTFTNEDAATGKVIFRAIADVEGVREALPANNEATALLTKVTR